MKREFLQNLKVGEEALPKELIDAIMAENGKDIQAAKDALWEGKTASQWKQAYDQAVTDHEDAVQKMEFRHTLEQAISRHKGKNAKAITALLDVDALQSAQDVPGAITQALEGLQKECAYLFGDDRTPPPYANGTGAFAGAMEHKPATLAGALRKKFERK